MCSTFGRRVFLKSSNLLLCRKPGFKFKVCQRTNLWNELIFFVQFIKYAGAYLIWNSFSNLFVIIDVVIIVSNNQIPKMVVWHFRTFFLKCQGKTLVTKTSIKSIQYHTLSKRRNLGWETEEISRALAQFYDLSYRQNYTFQIEIMLGFCHQNAFR